MDDQRTRDEAAGPGALVVGVDGSAHARDALAWAVDEAVARGAELVVVGVAPTAPDRVPGWWTQAGDIEATWQAVVDDAVGLAFTRDPSVPVRGTVRWGAAADELVGAASAADLLVVGARGAGGFTGLLVGSVADRCLRRARGPVAVVRPAAPADRVGEWGGRVVVGIDGSDDARGALRWALDDARLHHGSVEAVVAWQYPPTHAVVATAALRFAEAAEEVGRRARADAERLAPGVPVTVTVVDEAIVPALVDRARGAALLVVGSHGQGAYRDVLLGSVAAQCAHHAECTVVVVHGATAPLDGPDVRGAAVRDALVGAQATGRRDERSEETP